jgi:hypothetical protein
VQNANADKCFSNPQEDVMKRILVAGVLAAGVLALLGFLPGEDNQHFTDWSEPVNLGPVINSAYVDSCVAISKNGLSLFFSSTRNAGMNRDLFVSQRGSKDDPWGTPLPLTMLNTMDWESCPALSLDEYWLYFTSPRPGGCGRADIWVSQRQDLSNDFGWEAPVNLGCVADGYLNSKKDDLMPAFFEDEMGRVLMYFSSDRPVSKFVDIYQSEMGEDGTFASATPVAELNSHDYDMSTTVRRDGLEVIFGSDRPGGSGNRYSMDFWTATRATTSDPWSEPVFVPSLGSPAWMGGRIALSYDGCELYFTSFRAGGYGSADLWVAKREKLGDGS